MTILWLRRLCDIAYRKAQRSWPSLIFLRLLALVSLLDAKGTPGITERAWVLHGSDGLDEMTTTGPTHVVELADGQLRRFEITPEEAGLARAAPEALKGGEPSENAQALRDVVSGKPGAYRDIAILNAAGALVVAGKAATLKDGAGMAAKAIDSGKVSALLDRVIAVTNA